MRVEQTMRGTSVTSNPSKHITKSDSETVLFSETSPSLQKLVRVFSNYFVVCTYTGLQKLIRRIQNVVSSYSLTILLVFRNDFVVFRLYFVVVGKYLFLFGHYLFVIFRNDVRRIRDRCMSYSVPNVPGPWNGNFYSQTTGNVDNRMRGHWIPSLAFSVGWVCGAGAVSFRRWLRGPRLAGVRVRWGGVGWRGWGRGSELP